MIITGLKAAIRDGTIIERDTEACDEYRAFEQKANGTYGAKDGAHDDIVITRAIALHAASHRELRVLPKLKNPPGWQFLIPNF